MAKRHQLTIDQWTDPWDMLSAWERRTRPAFPFKSRVYQVTDQLYAGPYPGDKKAKAAQEKLTWLLDRGVDRFISLMEPLERDPFGRQLIDYQDPLATLATKRKLQLVCQRFPVRDMTAPTIKKTIQVLDTIDQAIETGHTVYVHCLGGLGRTGAIIGCWLSRHGIATGTDALIYLDHLREKDPTGYFSPQTTEQLKRIINWRSGR